MPGILAEWYGRMRAAARGTRGIVRLLAACGLASPLSGCYVMQAATGQLDVMASSRPIPTVLADPGTPPATRTRIELASEARDFAIHELALPDSGSYERYADLGRPYALWNVVATPEFSLQPLRWCFPVAGCVTYRGYFSESGAQAMAWKLAVACRRDRSSDCPPAKATPARRTPRTAVSTSRAVWRR